MLERWGRTPLWVDWVLAAAVAVLVFNLNVTSAGDPLSGLGRSAGPDSAGITETARAVFYGSLVVGGLVLLAAGLVPLLLGRGGLAARLVVRTYGGVAVAGLLGLLLDHRDGPVRTVHLVVYLMVALGVVRVVRIAALTSSANAAPAGQTPVTTPSS